MKVNESPLRDAMRLFMWYPVRWLICSLPVSWAVTALKCLGDIHYGVARGSRKKLRQKASQINSGRSYHKDVVREYFRNHYVDQLFILIFPKMTIGEIRRHIEIQGESHLKKSLGGGRGVILIHGHFGPALLPLVALSVCGYPIKQIGNPSDEGLSKIGRHVAYRLRMKYEGMMPADIIKVNSYLRPVFRALKNNEIIMTAGDGSGRAQEFGKQKDICFLGKVRRMPVGPALLAKKTGASLLPLFVTPGQKKLFCIRIGRQMPIHRTGEEDDDSRTMKAFWDEYESYIKTYPEYFHFLDRMKL